MISAAVDGAPRHAYYNPVLDPHCQRKMTPKMLAAVLADTYVNGGPLNEPDNEGHEMNLVSSLCDDGLHRPALDIDITCFVVDSSTPGHCHLYFPTVELAWDDYVTLLDALATAGILDRKYVEHSIARGQTLLRPPWVTK